MQAVVLTSEASLDVVLPNAPTTTVPHLWNLENIVNRTDWFSRGRTIAFLYDNCSSAWGFWLITGEKLGYGKAKQLCDSQEYKDMGGPPYRTLMNRASVCRRFGPEGWHYNLSFSHHSVLQALKPEQREEMLQWAERTGATVTDLIIERDLRYPPVEKPVSSRGRKRAGPMVKAASQIRNMQKKVGELVDSFYEETPNGRRKLTVPCTEQERLDLAKAVKEATNWLVAVNGDCEADAKVARRSGPIDT